MSSFDYTNKVLNVLGRNSINPLPIEQQEPQGLQEYSSYGANLPETLAQPYPTWGEGSTKDLAFNPYYEKSINTYEPRGFRGTESRPFPVDTVTGGSDAYNSTGVYRTVEEALAAGDDWAAYRKDHLRWREENPDAGLYDYPGNPEYGIPSDSSQIEDMTGKTLSEHKIDYALDEVGEIWDNATDYVGGKVDDVTDWFGDTWDSIWD
jgi:hypothetical protein